MKKIKMLGSPQFLLVDDEDYERCKKERWRLTGVGKQVHNSYREMIANFILKSSQLFDHKDCNFLNNQKINLRLATVSQNGANKFKYKKEASSKFKGVSYCNRDDCWRSYIKVNQKSIALGTFKSEIAAAKTYDNAARKYFGEFANLNFPRVAQL